MFSRVKKHFFSQVALTSREECYNQGRGSYTMMHVTEVLLELDEVI
jgi:hypothetical protein